MYSHYLYWQYIVAPRWLLRFFWTLQQALLQFFSVRVMLLTLFAHWRRDRVGYSQGSLSTLLRAVAWNAISRGVGFCVRSTILLLWLVSEVFFLMLAGGAFALFVVAPLLAMGSIAYGAALIIAGGG